MASIEGNAPGVAQEVGSSPVKLALPKRLQNKNKNAIMAHLVFNLLI